MIFPTLAEMIQRAQELKPPFDDNCNHCGWCCLTEVCITGKKYGASEVIPCQFLAHCGDKHYCSLMIEYPETRDIIGAGTGCDAITQYEQLKKLASHETT